MMSASKHTPGPWIVDGPPNNQIVWSDEENRVCFLAHSEGRDDERDIANGRLICAAPDLLELLRKASQLASVASDWNLYEVEIDGQMVGIYDLKAQFDTAISKAEGQP